MSFQSEINPSHEPTRIPGRRFVTLLLVAAAVALGLTLGGIYDLAPDSFAQTGATAVRVSPSTVTGGLPSFAELADAVSPAVVSIQAVKIERGSQRGNALEFFFGPRGQQPQGPQPEGRRADSAGSGFLISADGLVVTNHHVIEGADNLVVFRDGEEFQAELVGDDPATDIALLQLETNEELPYLELADSDRVRVGDWLMVIGSPLQLNNSVSVGVVSAKGRSINITPDRSLENFIQTDAAINFGNSGGPLVNLQGQVIGIATAINFGAENIGFAVPVNILSSILPQLRETGTVSRGYIGVDITNLDEETAAAFGLDQPRGALVNTVRPDTPAQKAGLEHGDIIVRVDDEEVVENRDLIDYVSALRPGTKVQLRVLRGREYQNVELELGQRPGSGEAVAQIQPEEEGAIEWLGIQYQDATPQIRSQHNMPEDLEGVLITVVEPDSPLYDKNVRPLDVLTEVNGHKVESVEAFEDAVESVESGGFLRLYLTRFDARSGASRAYFAIVRVP
ncbi:MAG: Do family serine endopeptidase [Thermoanaerobaculia bacterium]|nr:Do family serine endopeptidase [Thermoanaerobaculia bacterium]